MAESNVQQNLIVKRMILEIPQRFSTGPVMGRFLKELRDNKRIMANRCPKCGRFQLPPREVCAICRVEAVEFVEVGPEGVIQSYDLVYYASPDPLTGEARQAPYTTVNVLLDGVEGKDTLWHLLDETDPKKIKRGMRVRAIFNEQRSGSVTDIKHFKIIENE
ncbi:MAG: OB-fold domain-containing protein [Candidatus Alcyoniella australis]|nr:OB-fold domain-containing protein [Candidatus Alcyoniella australis]